jgi:hypothetical protein
MLHYWHERRSGAESPHLTYLEVQEMNIKAIKHEIDRQLDLAKEYAIERKEWDMEKNTMQIIGAYHLGRKEALESIKKMLG